MNLNLPIRFILLSLSCFLALVAGAQERDILIPDVVVKDGHGPATAPAAPVVSPHALTLTKVAIAAFSPDGRVLMTVGEEDAQVHFWNPENGEEVNRFGVAITGGALFSADGRRVLTWGNDNVVRVFDARTGKALRRLQDDGEGVRVAAISPDGSRALTSAGGSTVIKLWDTSTGHVLGTLEGHASAITALAFSPDGNQAVSLSGDPLAMTGPRATGSYRSILLPRAATQPTTAAAKPVPAATMPAQDVTLRHWDLQTRKPLRKIDLASPAQSPYFSADGKLVLVAQTNVVKIYELSTGLEVAAPRTPQEIFPPGQLTGDRKTGLWKAIGAASITNALTGENLRPLEGPIDGLPLCNAFSADGSRVILGTGKVGLFTRNPNEPGRVYVYDVSSGKRLAVFTGHPREVTQVVLSPDAKHAFSRDGEKTLFLWSLPR